MFNTLNRKFFSVAGAVMAAAALAAGAAHAQDWPNKPVRIIAPFPPGGSVDQVSRVLANYLAPSLGQQVIVDNKGGAAGSIGTALAAKAAPDGYTFVVVFDTHAVNPSLIPNMAFDTLKDFSPVMLIGTSAMVLTAHPSQPYQNFSHLIKAAKAKPENIGFGTIGTGSLAHLAMTQLQMQGGFKLTHVPYKGGGPLKQDSIAGHVPVSIASNFVTAPDVKSGALRPLAVTSAKRLASMPNVATVAEQGFPGFAAYAWWGLLAPAGTPKPIVERMHAEVLKVLNNKEARERLSAQGMDIVASSPTEFAKFLGGEVERWAKVVKDNDIKAGE
jgi:tripartite-type tricarboxylate transporter receptor subunit TctC